MRARDLLWLATESLLLHRVRTVLTLAAIAVGLLAVLSLAGVGEATKRYVLDQFGSIGSYLITVSSGRLESSGLGSAADIASARPLTIADADAIRRRVPGAKRVVALSLGTAAVGYASRHRDVYLIGASAEFAPMRDLHLRSGAFLPAARAAGRERVAVLGSRLARELFDDQPPVGRVVRIAESRFRVVGVLASRGSSLGIDLDDMALVPTAAGMALLGQSNLHHIMIQAASAEALPQVREQVRAVLAERHGEEDFSLVTQDAMLATVRGILDTLTRSLSAIAALSLLVAGVGIMNVMLVSVSERVGEIGLLKSLGGRPNDLRNLFLAEALVLCLLGAVAGVVLNLVAVATARTLWPAFPLSPEPMWIASGMLFVAVVGVTFGWLPARRAARWPAAEALRRRA